jgi:hypothetical protein
MSERTRDAHGRFRPGCSGNPGGRKRDGAVFEAATDRILELVVSRDALDSLPPAARALLPAEPTYHDALAAVLVAASLAGDDGALRELLKRLWPAPRPVEVSARPGFGHTVAHLLQAVRDDR